MRESGLVWRVGCHLVEEPTDQIDLKWISGNVPALGIGSITRDIKWPF
jgi:hypothetical protein